MDPPQRAGKVSLVLRAAVLGLEEQDELRCEIRNAVLAMTHNLPKRQADGVITAADPDVAVVRLPEHIQHVAAGGRVADPRLVQFAERGAVDGPPLAGPDDLDVQAPQCLPD